MLRLLSKIRDLWPLRYLIRVMSRYDLTKKITFKKHRKDCETALWAKNGFIESQPSLSVTFGWFWFVFVGFGWFWVVLDCFSLFGLVLVSKIVKCGQHCEICETWPKLSNLVRFGLVWFGMV